MSKPLTPALQRWLEHVRAAEARSLTLKAYAAEQGLSVDQLYAGKAKLKRKGLLPGREPAFLPVRVTPGPGPGAVLTIRLPNGVSVEVPEGATPATVRGVLDALLARA
jgi:hypothetical protein